MATKKKGSTRQPGQPGQSKSDQLVTSPAVNCSHSEMRETKSLNGNPKNPNKHPEEQLRIYAKILRHQGWRKSIVVSRESGLIVTGHGAWLTAVAEGWDQVPIDLQSFKSPEDEFAHMVADNRLPQMSEMAEAELSALIEQEIAGKLDIELAGLVEALEQEVKIEKVEVQRPPAFAWCLIGLPIVEFGPVQALLDKLPASAVIKTTQNDGPKDQSLVTSAATSNDDSQDR